jgi:hypothetical protein
MSYELTAMSCFYSLPALFVYEWRRHSSFYFQLEPAVILDNHDGRGLAFFGATFSLSQLGHLGSFFSSSYTRKARLQSLHSYSVPGIFPHLLGPVFNRSILYHVYCCCPGLVSQISHKQSISQEMLRYKTWPHWSTCEETILSATFSL